ncbi:UbiA family prenyltransferase [Sphaerisporangium sp. NPDC049002]|uniref:UbiA family prenyltransferase n=1 Tax=unclassified Sphaerisporangium TaxID=2630420 RepID=UPI0033D40E17
MTGAGTGVAGAPAAGLRTRLLAHVQTWRPYTMLYIGLVGLAGGLLNDPRASGWALAGAWAVPTLGWIGGHYGGDYFDRRLDAVAKPHRPIPSGRMPARDGLAGLVACTAGGAVAALLLNWRTLLLVAAALAAGLGYSAVLKARGLSGNLVRGSLTAFALLFGAMATAPYPAPYVLPVAAVFLLHDMQSNLVGTLRDIGGDRDAGYETFPVRRGARPAVRVVVAVSVAWVALAAAVPALSPSSPEGDAARWAAYWPVLGACVLLAAAAIGLLARAAEPMPPPVALRAHAVLVVERVALAGAFVGLAAGPVVMLAATLPALLATIVLQAGMRTRYEFGAATLA